MAERILWSTDKFNVVSAPGTILIKEKGYDADKLGTSPSALSPRAEPRTNSVGDSVDDHADKTAPHAAAHALGDTMADKDEDVDEGDYELDPIKDLNGTRGFPASIASPTRAKRTRIKPCCCFSILIAARRGASGELTRLLACWSRLELTCIL